MLDNAPSTSAAMFRTPHAPSHALYTPHGFSLGFPPHDHAHAHAAYLQPGPSNYGATPGAAPRLGYPHPSSAPLAPHAAYPGPPPGHSPYSHKARLAATTALPVSDTDSPTMAISLPHSALRAGPQHTPSSSSDRASSRGRGSHSGSDAGRDPTPPASRARPRDAKKKVHNCWMCHKSFDRPSTLKKHLLVHTGEKAFACESCGRRFGVASNLNRHARTCRAANPGGAAAAVVPAAGSSSSPAVASPTSSDASGATIALASAPAPAQAPASPSDAAPIATATAPTTASRKASSTEDPNTTEMSSDARQTRARKRARRAPSPVLWVPESLKAFDLTPLAKGTPVPLPPVRPFQENNRVEERDSFDENASPTPYHPHGWKGRLPGPGLLGHNVANRAGGHLLIF
ncbi:hypothetical protein BD413DRAFT_588516 [Trametes elegans]|nr:hypothetical protein BD413DRAFT_588516 [Trametes elegans]